VFVSCNMRTGWSPGMFCEYWGVAESRKSDEADGRAAPTAHIHVAQPDEP
jgi:hypothetical protein